METSFRAPRSLDFCSRGREPLLLIERTASRFSPANPVILALDQAPQISDFQPDLRLEAEGPAPTPLVHLNSPHSLQTPPKPTFDHSQALTSTQTVSPMLQRESGTPSCPNGSMGVRRAIRKSILALATSGGKRRAAYPCSNSRTPYLLSNNSICTGRIIPMLG
eukprot:1130376-Rhodomonas_salina.1